jgi:hypothetical protein
MISPPKVFGSLRSALRFCSEHGYVYALAYSPRFALWIRIAEPRPYRELWHVRVRVRSPCLLVRGSP